MERKGILLDGKRMKWAVASEHPNAENQKRVESLAGGFPSVL